MLSEKTHVIISAFTTLLLLLSFVIDIPLLRVIVVIFICGMMFFCSTKMATCHFFFFSSFFWVLNVSEYLIYVFISISYIISVFAKTKMEKGIILYIISLLAFVFFNTNISRNNYLKLGDLIPVIMLIQIVFVCNVVNPRDYVKITNWFVGGFLISAIIGLFANDIPALQEVLRSNYVYTFSSASNIQTISRYVGLTFDSNFFGLTTCIVVSILLFRPKVKHNSMYMLIALTLTILGFSTYSKSYMLVMVAIICVFLTRVDMNFMLRIIYVVLAVAVYVIIDYAYDLGYISDIVDRFSKSNDINSLTTNRFSIWMAYLKYIFHNGSMLICGDGLNSDTIKVAAHNTYIEMLYYFGFFGTFLWYKFFVLSYKKIKDGVAEIMVNGTTIPLGVLLVYVFFLSAMSFTQIGVMICVIFFNMNIPSDSLHIGDNCSFRSEINE